MNDYRCYVITNKPQKIPPIQESIRPEILNHFDGTGFNSFSKLVNQCVYQCPTERIIIMSDKVMPNKTHIEKTLSLLDQGYAFVALFRFAFFGFDKELFRKIGPLDERFIGGGHEDEDFYLRLYESNLPMYITEEVPYERSASSWNYELSKGHFFDKWGDAFKIVERKLPEENYIYNFGDSTNKKFLNWSHSLIKPMKVKRWFMRPMVLNNKIVQGPIKPKGKI